MQRSIPVSGDPQHLYTTSSNSSSVRVKVWKLKVASVVHLIRENWKLRLALIWTKFKDGHCYELLLKTEKGLHQKLLPISISVLSGVSQVFFNFKSSWSHLLFAFWFWHFQCLAKREKGKMLFHVTYLEAQVVIGIQTNLHLYILLPKWALNRRKVHWKQGPKNCFVPTLHSQAFGCFLFCTTTSFVFSSVQQH